MQVSKRKCFRTKKGDPKASFFNTHKWVNYRSLKSKVSIKAVVN